MAEDPQIHYLVDLFKSYHQTLLRSGILMVSNGIEDATT